MGDFNNDGFFDLFFIIVYLGDVVRLYKNNGEFYFVNVIFFNSVGGVIKIY